MRTEAPNKRWRWSQMLHNPLTATKPASAVLFHVGRPGLGVIHRDFFISQPARAFSWLAGFGCLSACLLLASVPTQACTIFVLADADRVLFCNNEDCQSTHTRVWFVPAEKDRLGCVYVGLRNQWAQGGMNTKGLAFDGVAGISLDAHTNANPVQVQPRMKRVRGNPSERMLERCGTVDEAVAFYQSHKEPTFSYATIMLADRSGNFAVLGAKGGRLHVLRGKGCAAWGWNGAVASKMITQNPTSVVSNAANILNAARSDGEYATKYSNVFDLVNGEVALFDLSQAPTGTSLGLAKELAKGRHFYDMHDLRDQLKGKPRRLSRFKEWEKNVYCWFHGNG